MAQRRAWQKPLSAQVVVITGASSGIGLSTARRAAARGAAVVLVSRGADALARIADDIRANGGRALPIAADVGVEADVRRVVDETRRVFGGFDTWVNNAGVAAYATLVDLPLDEHEQIFRTNYWGTVHGSLAAARHFRDTPDGGTIVNVGSVNSDVAVPLLSAYSASKHAVKGFTDALRTELMHAGDPVQVTLIKPSGIATPFPQHARNHLSGEPRIVPPLYAPELVADAILHAATHPVRDLVVGAFGRVAALAAAAAPNVSDRMIAAFLPGIENSSHPRTPGDNLVEAGTGGAVHNIYARGLPFSPYTAAAKHPAAALGLVALAAFAGARLLARGNRAGRG